MRPNLRERIPAFVLLLAVACGGSKKGDAEKPGMGAGEQGAAQGAAAEEQRLPAIPASPAPLPGAVLAAISIGDPQGQLASIAGFADAVQPGFGAMLAPAQLIQGVAGSVGAPGLDGVDLGKPLHLLLLDPQKGGGQALLVVAVADQQKMAASVGGAAVMQVHAGYAAIGARPALQIASPYALSSLARTAPPKHLHAVVYMNRIMESFGGQLDAQLRRSMGANPTEADKKAAEGLIKVFGSIERLEADLEASAQMASASLAVFPVQGSVLAQWNGLQKPSDYTVASRLPAGSWLMVSAGHFDLGPLQGFLGQLATAKGYPEVAAWLSLLGQESAVALLAKQDKTLRMAGLVAVTDGKKLAQLAADYAKKTAAKPPAMDSMDMSAKANAYRTGGSSLHAITLKPGAKMSADDKKEFEKIYGKGGLKTYFGVAGDWLIFSLDKDQGARSLAAKLVQGSKSKQPKSGLAQSFEKAVADSKARSESGVMVFDLGALAPDPSKVQSAQLALGIGFEGPVMRSRLTLPPDTLRFLVQQQMRGGQQPPP